MGEVMVEVGEAQHVTTQVLNLIFGYFGGVVRFGFSRIRKLYPYSWEVGEDTSILGIYFKCLLIAAEAQFSTDFL